MTMRAYVITGEDADADDGGDNNIAVTSGKKRAMTMCTEFLDNVEEDGVIVWSVKDKHYGIAAKGDFVATYRMFFVNQSESESEL